MKFKQFFLVSVVLMGMAASILWGGLPGSFTVATGREVSGDGSVMVAHNEDHAGKTYFVNMHKLDRKFFSNGDLVTLRHGGSLAQVVKTFQLLWIELPGVEYGDSYMNEYGVVVTSNSCRSREDKPELVNGGIGFMLRRIIAERAISARHGVELAGRLLQRFGYAGSGRSYVVADPSEVWVLQVVRGKHWVAQRVPHEHAAVIANRYTIGAVDLDNKTNFMGSPDIVDYAVKRGWYKPSKDGGFHFANAYADPKNFNSRENVLRQWRGTAMLARAKFKDNDPLPFSFAAEKKLRVPGLFRVLRDHYEDSVHDVSKEVKDGSPNTAAIPAICNRDTRYSFVAQLREKLPREVGALMWVSFGRPDSNAFCPWYAGVTAPPEGYTNGSGKTALETHFKRPPSFFKPDPAFAFWSFEQLSRLVDGQYRSRIKMARKEWRNFENYALKRQGKMEKEFAYLLKKNRPVAVKIITNYVHHLEYRKWFLASELLSEMK